MTPHDAAPVTGASSLAVLVSGGLDSAILLAESLTSSTSVYPLYIRCGLFWETVELTYLHRFLAAVHTPALQPLHILEMPARDLYLPHWSITGEQTPGDDTPDEAVFLPGRNVLLLSKAILWCHLRGVPAIALASLKSNPFPDATPSFFTAFEAVVNQAVGGRVRVIQPYLHLHKAEVLQRGKGLPLELTFSCLHPRAGLHCGACNKCAERRKAFKDAGLPDRTPYQVEQPCSA